ncbi:MAG: diguanylate cyclase [Oscillospiraceae bacterium]|nr:diguanylate cyclase [Oscillospiraceae bacterium]
MKQFQFSYNDNDDLKTTLTNIRQWCSSSITSHIVFQIYTETIDNELISEICSVIAAELPDAEYLGCSTNGNIINGEFSGSAVNIICTIFEYPTSKVEIFQYALTAQTENKVMRNFLKEIEKRPWIKAIELLTTIRGMSMTDFCDILSTVRPDIHIFGGGAFSSDINDVHACVFSKKSGISDSGVVFILMGGDDFHAATTYIAGWKPLGKTFHVTSSEGSLLHTLDDQPAYEVYSRYLNIDINADFFFNTLEFPFFYHHNGIDILRAPTACLEDGTLVMTSDMEENVSARLAYGDPDTIIESVYNEGKVIRDFLPEVIKIYSCAARRTFWGNAEVSKESQPFCNIAPTSGFYTSGEFLRTEGNVNQHNVTMVVAGMREGGTGSRRMPEFEVSKSGFTGKVSLISRLASYINAAFDELEKVAVTDGLTKLYNRAEIQRRIEERFASGQHFSLIMLDIDNFKSVNDFYGHDEGDTVIIGVADLLRTGIAGHIPEASVGRWGGEEFMFLLPFDLDYAKRTAANIIRDFNAIEFPNAGHQTLSIGISEAREDDTIDKLLIRVDKALYDAKRTGKNKYMIL